MNLERVIAVRTNETVYRGGDQCVKVFGDGFTKADALGEALNQARVEECGLHVPKVLEVSQVDGKWALVTEYVEGKTLERLIAEEPGRKEELLERMAELQVEMISKSCGKNWKTGSPVRTSPPRPAATCSSGCKKFRQNIRSATATLTLPILF